ncbi:hypothetical protein V2G26_016314 [Clonostachys chloroleuca]
MDRNLPQAAVRRRHAWKMALIAHLQPLKIRVSFPGGYLFLSGHLAQASLHRRPTVWVTVAQHSVQGAHA